VNKLWSPSKPSCESTNAEMQETHIFSLLQKATGLPVNALLPLTRATIDAMWLEKMHPRASDERTS